MNWKGALVERQWQGTYTVTSLCAMKSTIPEIESMLSRWPSGHQLKTLPTLCRCWRRTCSVRQGNPATASPRKGDLMTLHSYPHTRCQTCQLGRTGAQLRLMTRCDDAPANHLHMPLNSRVSNKPTLCVTVNLPAVITRCSKTQLQTLHTPLHTGMFMTYDELSWFHEMQTNTNVVLSG